VVSRRKFLVMLRGAAGWLFGACGALPERLQFGRPTATPGEARVVRLARPGLDMRVADTHVEVANKRVPEEKRLRFEVVPIDPVRTEVGLNGAVSVRSTDPVDWPIDWAGTLATLTGEENLELVLLDSRWVSAFARIDALHDLAPMVRGDPWLAADKYVGNALDSGRVQGRQLAFPLMVYADGLLFDRVAFDDAGVRHPRPDWRRTDLLDAAQALTRGGRWGVIATADSPALATLAWQGGAQLVNAQGTRIDLTERGTLDALRFLGDLVHRHKVAPAPAEDADPPATMLAQKTAAMIGWRVGGLIGNRTASGIDLAPWPAAGEQNVAYAYAPLMVGVLKSTRDRDRAFAGLRALAEASAQTMLLPARRTDDLRTIVPDISPPDATALDGLLRIARFLPGDVPLFRVGPTIDRLLIQPVLRGEKRAEEAVAEAQPEVDRVLAAFHRRPG
jgi:ABC-type glycerol-3-phosphate transport system substrate-binding protein